MKCGNGSSDTHTCHINRYTDTHTGFESLNGYLCVDVFVL